jgi:hypothetical protein
MQVTPQPVSGIRFRSAGRTILVSGSGWLPYAMAVARVSARTAGLRPRLRRYRQLLVRGLWLYLAHCVYTTARRIGPAGFR